MLLVLPYVMLKRPKLTAFLAKKIDMLGDNIKYYCFNKKCTASIFSPDCIISEVSLADSLEIQYCEVCLQEMTSKEELSIKVQLNNLLHDERQFKSIIIDDDPIYHMIVNKLFESSHAFDEYDHYIDGRDALAFLRDNIREPAALPDIIFVDINMPEMDAWEFLQEFSQLYSSFDKKIEVYVMTNLVQKEYHEKIRNYPYVKGIIAKNFDTSFLNSIAV